jgi:hypothetical protein
MVRKSDSKILWVLDGANRPGVSTFAFGKNAGFAWQHDVELHKGGSEVTVFNDNCCGMTAAGTFEAANGPTEGMLLALNYQNHTASLLKRYLLAGVAGNAGFLGNTELLPNGGAVLGWGTEPFFSEFNRSGKQVFEVAFPTPNLSYRTFLQRWVGKPSYPPSLWAAYGLSLTPKVVVKVSWNGATQVAAWRVLTGGDPKHLKTMATRPKSGFETTIDVAGNPALVKVQALDSRGHVIGSAGPITPLPGY